MTRVSIEKEQLANDQVFNVNGMPEGWTFGTLQDIVGPGGILTDGDWVETKDQDPEGDARLIQLADIGDGSYKNKSQHYLTSKKAKELGCTFLHSGDVLIARLPDPLGRSCLFPGDTKPSVTAVDVCIVRTGKYGADHHWIIHTVNSPVIRRQIEGLQRGTTRARISRKNLISIKLPIPPLAEQKRIVAKVEELLARANAARDHLAKVKEVLKRFRQSVLAAACSGRLTADWREKNPDVEPATELLKKIQKERKNRYEKECEKAKLEGRRKPKKPDGLEFTKIDDSKLPEIPENWCWAHLQNLGELSRGRSQHRPRNDPKLFGGKYPFIQTGDVARSNGFIKNHNQTYNETGLAQSRLFPQDTLCITIAANIADTGIITYPACFPDSIAGFIPEEGMFEVLFAMYYVRIVQNDLQTFAPATAQKNINLGILHQVAVPAPPLTEQQEIVRRVKALFKIADQIEERYKKARTYVDKLTQSILAKAFRGELVPQDPNDELACVLLERIQKERKNEGLKGKPARKPVKR